MRNTTHTATFRPSDSLQRIFEDLACPACGYRDPGAPIPSITGDRLRFFCDCCGTFSTFVLSAEQAAALDRRDTAAYSSRPNASGRFAHH